MRRFVHREGNSIFIGEHEYSLDTIGRVHILGLGKACAAMSLPLADLFSDHPTRGLLIPKQTPVHPPGGFDLQPGGHPVPDENSLLAGHKAFSLAQDLGQEK